MQSLLASLPLYNLILQQSSDSLYLAPEDGGFKIWNKNECDSLEFLGGSYDPWVGMEWKAYIDRTQRPVIGIMA